MATVDEMPVMPPVELASLTDRQSAKKNRATMVMAAVTFCGTNDFSGDRKKASQPQVYENATYRYKG